jgi:ubiquinone/menaquinone biosynthesis C-methylase UbiE
MALPFATASFDLVLSHAVIEHVADAPLYLRECRRVLRPAAGCTSRRRPTCRLPARTCRG